MLNGILGITYETQPCEFKLVRYHVYGNPPETPLLELYFESTEHRAATFVLYVPAAVEFDDIPVIGTTITLPVPLGQVGFEFQVRL